jgi:DNA-binding transcriptional LysR family regulator
MRIDPNNLLTFLAVAEAGGFNKAALTLHKSQPALTRTVHQLEELVGASVFNRQANGVVLTPEGEWLLGHARAIRQQLNDAQRGLEDIKENRRVRVTIGTAAVHPLRLFSKAVMEVLAQNPDMDLRILMSSEAALLDLLRQGELSFIIVPMPRPDEVSMMYCETVFLDEAAIFCRPDHPLAGARAPTVADLHQFTWMLGPAGSLQRDRLDTLFASAGLLPAQIGLEVEDLRLRRALIMECLHLSVFSRHHVEELVRAGGLVEVRFPFPQDRRPVVAIELSQHSSGRRCTPSLQR